MNNKIVLEEYIKSDSDWWSPSNERTIQVEERESQFSGLLDKYGKPLYKKKHRIGYI